MTHDPQMTGTKVCTKCGEEKAVIAFAVKKHSSDGLRGACRECRNRLYKESRGQYKTLSTKYRGEAISSGHVPTYKEYFDD